MEEVPGHQHELDAEGLQAVQAVSNLVSRAMTAASQVCCHHDAAAAVGGLCAWLVLVLLLVCTAHMDVLHVHAKCRKCRHTIAFPRDLQHIIHQCQTLP